MRVLHIDTGTSMRGGQWQALYLLQGLRQRGIECSLFAPPSSPLLIAAVKAGCDAHALKLFPLLRQASRFDVVHAHDARAHTLALLASTPLVVSRRVAFPPKRTPASRFKYTRPACFLAVSHHVSDVLVHAGIPAAKIAVVCDGVPLPDAISFNDRTGIIAIDSDDPLKGKAIIEQASRLSEIPVHFSRCLVQDLREATLFVYITDLEGLGSAALFAMAHGIPVVASRTGGLPEIVEDGVTGLLTANDPATIAAAMKRLNGDRALAMRLGQQGRTVVERRFTVTRMVEDTMRVYERVYKRKSVC